MNETVVARLGIRRLAFRAALASLIPLLAALVLLTLSIRLIDATPFPAPDELEHVSYAAYLQETGRFLPDFARQRILGRDDIVHWDVRANYVGHPSPFYVLIAQVLDRARPLPGAILPLRLVSAALLLAGAIFALGAGLRTFADKPAALALFCAGLALCPELLSVASQVTNDSLAILGGGLAYWGAVVSGRRQVGADLAAAAGLLLALWAKPNAGLEIGVFLAVVILLQRCAERRFLAAIVLGGLVGVVPYVLIMLDHGAIVPVTAEGIVVVHSLPDPAVYVPAFFLNLGYTWGFLRTGAWPIEDMVGLLTIPVFWALIFCAAAGACRAWPRRTAPAAQVAVAAVVAFAVVLPIHLWFASTRLGGSIPAASMRYYLPLWPALMHAVAYAAAAAPRPWQSAGVVVTGAAALTLGWLT